MQQPPSGAELTLPALFEAALRRSPAACAVDCDGAQLTYAELAQQAGRAAAGLRQLLGPGGGGERYVALCVDEGPGMVVGMLAAAQAGAAFVPVDLQWPAARQESVLRRLGVAAAVVPDGRRAECLRAWGRLGVAVCGAAELAQGAAAQCVPPGAAPGPRSICWAIATSGTTGAPKMVLCEHRSASGYALAKGSDEQISPASRICVASHFTFDPCPGDVFAGLAHGARLCLSSRVSLVNDLPGVIVRSGATHCCVTPTHWALAESAAESAELRGRLQLSLGGEAMPQSMRDRWAPSGGLRCVYGVTEGTCYQTSRLVRPGDSARLVGTPLRGCEVTVTTPGTLEEVPPGAEGEVVLGGPSVCRGYAGDPEGGARRFVRGRYLTGDRGRMTERGLELLGRLDAQVKLRGVRIELEEVDSVLGSAPCVAAACACVAEGRLAAAVVPGGRFCGADPAAGDCLSAALELHCAARLPAAHVPSLFCAVESLPARGGSGKLDREAAARLCAAAADPAEASADAAPAAALSALEDCIARSWGAALGAACPAVLRREHHFTRLGGDSLAALRAARALRPLVRLPEPASVDAAAAAAAAGEGGADALGVASLLVAAEAPPGAVCLLQDAFGPLAPCELLAHPSLGDYAAHLAAAGVQARGGGGALAPPPPGGGDAARALVVAARHDWGAVLQTLLGAPPRPGWADAVLEQALRAAADAGSAGAVRQLMAAGAAPVAAAPEGTAAAHLAAARGQTAALEALLQSCAPEVALRQLRLRDADGQTPLLLAARAGCPAGVSLCLVVAGAAGGPAAAAEVREARDAGGVGAVQWAVRNAHHDVLDALGEAGAELSGAAAASAAAAPGDESELTPSEDESGRTGRVKRRPRGEGGAAARLVADRKHRRDDAAIAALVAQCRAPGASEAELCEAVEALRSLVCAVRSHRLAALACGAVPALVALLARGACPVAAHAAGTLRNLLHDAEGRAELLRCEGAVAALARCLEAAGSSDPNTAWRAAAAIAALSASEASWAAIARSGAVPRIEALAGRKLGLPAGLVALAAGSTAAA